MINRGCPHSNWWLGFITITPILISAFVVFLLTAPVDPWAAGAFWGAVIFFIAMPGILIPLICGLVTWLLVYRRKQRISRCLLLAILPSILISIFGVLFLVYSAEQTTQQNSRLWQSKINTVPIEERDAVSQYLSIQDLVLTWVDDPVNDLDEVRNHHLVRLSGNAEACLRAQLPQFEASRINEFYQWIHVGKTDADDQKSHQLWQSVIGKYRTDHEQHRAHCDETLNFNTVKTRYPNG